MPVSRRTQRIAQSLEPFIDGMLGARTDAPDVADFLAGNPQEVAGRHYVETLQKWLEPKDKRWFAYGTPTRASQEAAAAGLSRELGIQFDPADILLCRGAHGGLAACLDLVVDPGDEVVFVSPPWFFYEAMILSVGAEPVKARVRPDNWDLDVPAIEAAITERTSAVLINTPHNPSGKVYPPETLQALADALTRQSAGREKPIYLISDEAYSRILFPGARMYTPASHYANSLLVHTYSKSALAPGQRLGYVALPPDMPGREELRLGMMATALGSGNAFPDAVMIYALADIEAMSIDLDALARRRDVVVSALQEMGYELHIPEATFYVLPRVPGGDERAFVQRLARDGVLVLPGRATDTPGYFRISLTATDAMVEKALPVFEAAIKELQPAAT
ncbi:MAG: aminotransferase class I/II-fold pyridoxal phosphate-dependent enzyme [Candidatus Dormibacteraeota bacterium]|nr:aminotransferase class I/II-fold pyridoxal phosphate-dependent enzyme [Candidatus Dormibacteraeota bacterium]